MAEPVEGRDARAPEEREPDEAEAIVRAASPRRLVLRIAAAVGLGLAITGGYYALRRSHIDRRAQAPPMVTIPAGTYRMGKVVREVRVAPFQIDVHEVTAASFRRCVQASACAAPIKHEGCTWEQRGRDDHPITCVRWDQAKAYCAWMEKRLPTEEEWEYAARGADGRRYPWGDERPGPALVNVCDGECRRAAERGPGPIPPVMFEASDGWGATAPVGSYPAGNSPFGVADMAGNVWEWTSSSACPQGEPGCAGDQKVMRGGGWTNALPTDVESTTRLAVDPTWWSDTLGFRCAR
jgi:formylglycine-generating enzyme required for sulfatase activity